MSEFEKYLSIASRWWWLLMLSTLLGAGAGLGITVKTPPEYRASASVLVRTGGSTNDYSAVMASEKMALTYENLITKRPVIEQAARTLGLEPDQIADQLDVRLVSKTLVIELRVTDRDPQRAANIANAVLAAFIRTQQESGNARARDITVVEVASPPPRPVSPNATRNLVLSSVGGGLLGASAVLAFELLNDRLEGIADVHHKLSIPILAVVPRRIKRPDRKSPGVAARRSVGPRYRGKRKRDRTQGGQPRISLPSVLLSSPYTLSSPNGDSTLAEKGLPSMSPGRDTPVSPGSDTHKSMVDQGAPGRYATRDASSGVEPYLALRTWLQFSYGRTPDAPCLSGAASGAGDCALVSLVITSPRSQRDNGRVAIDLGVALALADLEVVLVDADLREPSLHRFLEDEAAPDALSGYATKAANSGLSDLLARGGHWLRYAHATQIPNLSLLSAGSPAADPLRLFSAPEMARLLRQLRKGADVVLFNAPPVLAAADALVLAAQVDATLLVVEDRMPLKWAAQALTMLHNAQANVLGAVLTGARSRSSDLPPHCDFGPPVFRRTAEQRLSEIHVHSERESPEITTALALRPRVAVHETLAPQILDDLNALSVELLSVGNGGNDHVD